MIFKIWKCYASRILLLWCREKGGKESLSSDGQQFHFKYPTLPHPHTKKKQKKTNNKKQKTKSKIKTKQKNRKANNPTPYNTGNPVLGLGHVTKVWRGSID